MTQKETWTCVTRYSALPPPLLSPTPAPKSVQVCRYSQYCRLRPESTHDTSSEPSGAPAPHRRCGGQGSGCTYIRVHQTPDFSKKMFSIASVTRIDLLHILKPSTIPILKCIWGHLGGPHPPWSSQNFLNLHHYAQNFKIVVQRSSYAHSKALDETKIL